MERALSLLDFSRDGGIELKEWLRAGQIDLRAAFRDRCVCCVCVVCVCCVCVVCVLCVCVCV